MKLTDLGLTAGGIAATKKLGKQVHKGTVAAAKEPRLNLGVLGISIGQQQSTGLTSRVNESLSVQGALALVIDLADEMGWKIDLEGAVDAEAALGEAIKICKLRNVDEQTAMAVLDAYRTVATQLISQGSIKAVAQQAEKFQKAGFKPHPIVKSAMDKVTEVYGDADSIHEHFQLTARLTRVLTALLELPHDHNSFTFANAGLKKLGLR